MSKHAAPDALVDALDSAGISYALVPHPYTGTATDEAIALEVFPSLVAKTIILVTPDGFVRASIPASERLDMHKVREVLGPDVRLATEEELAGAFPQFELGAIPPLPLGDGDEVILDVRLCANDEVLLDAGTHRESLRIAVSDLIELANCSVVDICER